jgi:hypothetical protein
MKYLKPMSDWSMSKDYNGAERFADGSRPLMAEINDYVVVVSGYDGSRKDNRVWVYVHFECYESIDGLTDSKEKGIELGELIAEHISNGTTKDDVAEFYKSLDFLEINMGNFNVEDDNI